MKKITLLLFTLFTCLFINAQTGTVIVGVNDGTPNTASGDPSPLQDYWKTQRTQYLYTAAELSSAGLVAGNITEIGWVATALNLSGLQENYTISMKSTTATSLTTTFQTGATVVYGPADFTPSSTGNVIFTLTTPFVWDGTSNIIIELCAGLASGGYTENVSCANSTMSGNYTTYYRNDSATAPCTTATGTTTNQRPLVVLTGNVATCLAPLNLVSASITAYTANVSWDASTSGSASGYEYVVSTSNVTPTGSGTPTTNLYASLAGLSPATTYYVFVRTNCGGTFSGWGGPISFTTACAPITVFPVLEPFATFLPSCWLKGDNGTLTAGPATFGTNGFYQDGFGNVGTTGSFAYNIWMASANDWIISPEYTIPATGYELKFDAAAANYGATTAVTNWEADDFVEVLVSSTGTTNWTVLYTYNNSNVPAPTGEMNIIDLDSYAGQTVRFAYRVVEGTDIGGADLEFFIDNFQIRLTPTCPDLTGLTVSGVTATTANTSWNDMSGSGATGYEYAITTSPTPPNSGTSTTAIFYAASGLLPQTVYYLHVRSSCTGGTFGNWSTVSFTTACAEVTSFIQNFDAVTTPAFPNCWFKVGTTGTVNTQTSSSSSLPNCLYIYGSSATNQAIVRTIPVSNLGAGTHRFKFKMRANFTVGGILELGYLTDPTDSNSFVALTSFTASSLTYANYVYNVPAGTYSSYPAFRHTGSPANSILVDDVIWEAMPNCPDQTGLIVSGITVSGANTSWDDMSSLGAIGYEYAVTTSATPPTSGTATASTFYAASGLTPQTVYYLHVRSSCSGGSFGNWSTTSFTTACPAINTLPWLENFDTTTTGTNIFPSCWGYTNVSSDWSIDTFPTAYSGANSLRRTWSTDGWAYTPMFTLTAGTSYTFSYYVRTNDTTVGYNVTIGVGSSQTSAAMTTTLSTVTGYQNPNWTLVTHEFTPTVSGDYSFGVHVVADFAPNGINFDNFELKLTPSIPPTCATGLTSTPNATCGNFSNTISWNNVTEATGYYVTIGTTSGGSDIANAVPVTGLSYNFTGVNNTQYFWKVVPYNGAGSATGCAEQSFTTAVNGCYCSSVPSSVDNSGITNVVLGATPYTIAPVTYVDNTATPEIIAPGATANLQLTFSTGYTYDINVWIDFNNDFDFDDAGELVKTGIACTNVQPNTVDASFTMPLTAPSGPHRMRIGSADFGQVPPAPCYNGSFGVTLDFTVDTSLATSSFDLSNFVAYPNPVKDVLNLSYSSTITNVKVTNLLGQQVINKNMNDTNVQVNMADLAVGTYIVNVTSGDLIHTIKVVKQ